MMRSLTYPALLVALAVAPAQATVAQVATFHSATLSLRAEVTAQGLWVVDNRTGQRRRLLATRVDDDPKRTLEELAAPRFSLEGGYIYVTSVAAWATSGAVHQVSVATGAERFVVAGDLIAVIRTGPYRGFLLVQQHRYYDRPEGGSYNPVYVVRPDGHEMFVVPGSENDDGEYAVTPWLRAKGWVAN